jgi:hypothetical protein
MMCCASSWSLWLGEGVWLGKSLDNCCCHLVQDEPGGYKALVFDQSNRVGQSVSAADVADICLRALYEPQVSLRFL